MLSVDQKKGGCRVKYLNGGVSKSQQRGPFVVFEPKIRKLPAPLEGQDVIKAAEVVKGAQFEALHSDDGCW